MRRLAAWVVVLSLVLPLSVLAQRGRFFGYSENVPYDGRFTFARVRYNSGLHNFGRGGSTNWNHDYPAADINLPLILDSLTSAHIRLQVSNIFDLEDPEIFRQPIIYMWEPGYWVITEEGARNLRDYLLKGGFMIFDDFEEDQWFNFEAQFRKAMPELEWLRLDMSHPIFHTFFDMSEVYIPHPFASSITPGYYGVFEGNDPRRRMLALANHNSDVAEYWEYSGRGYFPVDTTNDAYKIGVNYMIYGLTH